MNQPDKPAAAEQSDDSVALDIFVSLVFLLAIPGLLLVATEVAASFLPAFGIYIYGVLPLIAVLWSVIRLVLGASDLKDKTIDAIFAGWPVLYLVPAFGLFCRYWNMAYGGSVLTILGFGNGRFMEFHGRSTAAWRTWGRFSAGVSPISM